MAKKSKVKKTGRKRQKLSCDVCGLVLGVDEMCGCPDLSSVVCCGKQMTKR